MATPVSSRDDVITVEIASGQSLSPAVNLGGRKLTGIGMPASWTAASLTFQWSLDGATWSEATVTDSSRARTVVEYPVNASDGLSIVADELAPAKFLRVRSGTAASPVNQGAARTLTLVTREFW